MQIARTVRELRDWLDGRRAAFVPTMGALHEGHLALIRHAESLGEPVVVSIFVNPTQFGPNEDFSRYPRTLETDLAACEEIGADLVFTPAAEEIYPPGQPPMEIALPPVATEPGLEDAHRPGHFRGVCQVVARLFDLVEPAVAIFGEKDYQQLLVIRAMVKQEQPRWQGLTVTGLPTVRDPDGLAMSSRNRYLDPEQRDRALGLARALQAAHAAQKPDTAEAIMIETLRAHDLAIDYAVVRDSETLMPVGDFSRPTRALIAARLDDVRLIDNQAMTVWT
ncbi:MAG: pantoate--beta-alanine ligase [Phycisphaerales bacterium]|nr:MAG: pantoate--beta-alanine ligase [Phycisphaerales bacterium]